MAEDLRSSVVPRVEHAWDEDDDEEFDRFLMSFQVRLQGGTPPVTTLGMSRSRYLLARKVIVVKDPQGRV